MENLHRSYYISNVPKHIEYFDLWVQSIDILIKNKSNICFGSITSIYNNLSDKRKEQRKDWIEQNYKYWLAVFNNTNMPISKRKFYNDIILSLKQIGKISPKQLIELRRLEKGII